MILCNIHTHHIPVDETDNLTIINRIIGKDVFPFSDMGNNWWSIGIHPWYILNVEQQWVQLLKEVNQKNIVAIGEAGLDKLVGLPIREQLELFKKQAFLSEEIKKTLLIHCVKSWDELLAVKKEIKPSMPWVIHGFRGNEMQADQLLKHGFKLSFGLHFHPDSLLSAWPDNLFLETDDSDLPIRNVYEKAAECLPVSLDELAVQIRKNVAQTFSV